MNRRTLRTSAPLSLLLAACVLAAPAAEAAPQNSCSGAFCTTFDLGTYDALAPAQPTTAAAQPTDLALRFTDTSPAVATDKRTWLSKASVVLGSSSSKTMSVTPPAQLPAGAYVAGTTATASTCAQASDYAATCPAGSGSGLASVTPLLGTPETKPATFGITRITATGGAMTAEISVTIPSVTLVPLAASVPVTYAPATTTAGATLTIDTAPVLTGLLAPPYTGSPVDLSLNTLAVNLNGQVTEAALGGVNPAVAFVRQSTVCTAVTTTLVAQSRSGALATGAFPQTITGCPAAPALVSVTPVPGDPQSFAFAVQPPSAAVAGRSAQVEWVYGDGSRAVTGPTTTHKYPTTNPVIALATIVDSAGARSTTLQVHISGGRIRAKQAAGNRLTGVLADQDTGNGVPGQPVDAYRCATRGTPLAQCEQIGTGTTRADGSYRIRIPEVTQKGVALVAYAGTASKSANEPARFGSQRSITVLPQPDVTLRVSDRTVRPGATVHLSGKVEPGKKGKTVRLQGFLRGKWRSIGKATISSKGRYAAAYTVLAPRQDKVKVRALLPGTAATLEATSPVRKITLIGG
jgi:hypothetical protein